jgi:Uma2 family endonuclease
MAILTRSNTPLYEGHYVTREEYLDLPDDGFRYDMIEGVLHMSPSPYFSHNQCQTNISYYFKDYFIRKKSGLVVVETDVFLPDGGDVVRPDLSVILNENYKIIIGHIHGVPDIVCEVLSESTRDRDLGIKAARYLANGVKEYWIADPDKKSIEMWMNQDKNSWRKISGNEIAGSVLSGFILRQVDVFPKD